MKRVRFLGDSRLALVDAPIPTPSAGQALVRIAISAICGSELPALRRGTGSDRIHNPGHEMAGVVVEANDVCAVHEGQRVGLQVMIGCGRCSPCRRGLPQHCTNDMDYLLDAHAEYVAAPEGCLVPLPDDLDWEAAVLLCGDTMGTPYHALRRLGSVDAGQTAAVFGCGPIGLGSIAWLRYYGARTIVSETSPYRRALAEHLGAHLALDPASGDVVARIRQETEGGADLCLDCTGAPETLTHALDAARVHGRVGWIGEKPEATLNPSEQVIHKELSMAGAWYFTVADFWEMVDCYRRGLDLSGLITHRYPLADAPAAYHAFVSGETGKVVFCHKD